MVKVNSSQKSRIPRSPDDMSDPEIDLKQGEEFNRQLEDHSPRFKKFVDGLRKAAKAVGRNMKMILMLALTLGLAKHR